LYVGTGGVRRKKFNDERLFEKGEELGLQNVNEHFIPINLLGARNLLDHKKWSSQCLWQEKIPIFYRIFVKNSKFVENVTHCSF